jgi:signal transduction histidine kinase
MTDNSRNAQEEVVGLEAQEVEALQESLDRLRGEIDQLRASRKRIARAAEADRRNLERELHDGPQQELVSVAVNLQLARGLVDVDPAAAKELLDQVRRDVKHALDQTRLLADRIYPPLLEAGGLRVALRSAAATVGVPTRVQVSAGAGFPPEVASTVYFCCVTALERVRAGANATVTVREEEGAVVFEIVADGGVGFANAGEDLTAARDRVEALGGQLTIASEPADRTRVAGSLPLGR